MGGWQTKFNVSTGPGLWPLVLEPFGPDLGPDLDLTWDLDLSLTIPRWLNLQRLSVAVFQSMCSKVTLMRAGAHLGMTMSLATKWIQSFCIETTHL